MPPWLKQNRYQYFLGFLVWSMSSSFFIAFSFQYFLLLVFCLCTKVFLRLVCPIETVSLIIPTRKQRVTLCRCRVIDWLIDAIACLTQYGLEQMVQPTIFILFSSFIFQLFCIFFFVSHVTQAEPCWVSTDLEKAQENLHWFDNCMKLKEP